MKKSMLCFSAIFIMLGGCGIDSTQKATEEEFMDNDGLIRAYAHDAGSASLSESIGLYMEYLVNAENEKAFQEQVESLKKHFVVEKEGNVFIRWQLTEATQVNALIDDLRIIGALEAAGKKFRNEEYTDFGAQLADSVSQTQTTDGYTPDFYDWELGLPGSRITLSYLITERAVSQETMELLQSADGQQLFFPEYYDLKKRSYIHAEEVHMIDQLLIALNRSKIGIRSQDFDEWLIGEWREEHKLSGRYSRESLQPSVEYESLAVYYYLNVYFEAIGEEEMAEEVFDYTEKIADQELLAESHFFDFIHYQLLQQRH